MRTTTAASLVLPAAEIIALGTGPIGFEVVEVGTLPSRPALLTIEG